MNILIQTTQNVVLSYPLAGTGLRIAAFVIDMMIVIFLYVALMIIGLGRSDIILTLLLVLLFMTYHLLFEIFMNGQSPGKKLLNIQVVSIDGSAASLNQLLIRWSFRLIDIGVSIGTLGLFFMTSSSLVQKLGDLMAGTIVVSRVSSEHPGLSTLKKMNETSVENINPLLKKYTDEEMILLKTLLARNLAFDTVENKSLLRKMALKIKNDLGDSENTDTPDVYLSKILHDYVIITR